MTLFWKLLLFYSWQHHLKISHSHIMITNLLFFATPWPCLCKSSKPGEMESHQKSMDESNSIKWWMDHHWGFQTKTSKFQFLATLFCWVIEKNIPNKSSFSSFQRAAINKKNAKNSSAPCSQDDLRWAIQMSEWNESHITCPKLQLIQSWIWNKFPKQPPTLPKKKKQL